MCSNVFAPALMPIALTPIDAELVEQRECIARDIGKPEHAARVGGAPMPSKIGRDDAVSSDRIGEDVLPVFACSRKTMKQEERRAFTAIAIEELHSVDVGGE